MIASLPMYDWPELADSHMRFWKALADRLQGAGLDCPASLSEGFAGAENWLSSKMFFSQTCGYPFATKLIDKVQLIATPQYGVEGCRGANYSSAVIVAKDSAIESAGEFKDLSFAFNSRDSLSGYQCMKPRWGDPENGFAKLVTSGAHRNSAIMVAEGKADCAAIDAVCWDLFQAFEPKHAERLRVLSWAPEFPALPYITATHTSADEVQIMRTVLRETIEAEPELAAALRVKSIAEVPQADYKRLTEL